jgi:hypothetical protein
MTMTPPVTEEAASRPDEENPEWTREEFRRARPALDAIAEIFGVKAAEAIRDRAGASAKDDSV